VVVEEAMWTFKIANRNPIRDDCSWLLARQIDVQVKCLRFDREIVAAAVRRVERSLIPLDQSRQNRSIAAGNCNKSRRNCCAAIPGATAVLVDELRDFDQCLANAPLS